MNTKPANKNSQPWYSTPRPEQLPLAMPLGDAARLLGLDMQAAYWLANHDWQPFCKRFGDRGLLVRTRPLLEWIGEDVCAGEETTDDTQSIKETQLNGNKHQDQDDTKDNQARGSKRPRATTGG
jgi:hypothetical protein